MKSAILELANVSYTYPSEAHHQAIDDLSFRIFKGEWIAVVGQNGSGKSTTAKLINGLIVPEAGVIKIDKETLAAENVWELRQKVGLVFQNPDNQFVGATVEDDVAFGMENLGIPRAEMIERVDFALRDVRMSEFRNTEPARLSGGQKQRVAIAGIIALRPDILILDEATSMLDPLGVKEVLKTIKKLKFQNDLTVISITHDLEEAARADRILVLKNGKLEKSGTPEEIFQVGEKIIEWGLELPFTEALTSELKKLSVSTPGEYLNEERLVDFFGDQLHKGRLSLPT